MHFYLILFLFTVTLGQQIALPKDKDLLLINFDFLKNFSGNNKIFFIFKFLVNFISSPFFISL